MATSEHVEAASTLSRYEKVKLILDTASIGSTATYDGYGRFWNLPLTQFLELELYGIRLIAPEPTDFDHSSDAATAAVAPQGTCPHTPATVKSCCPTANQALPSTGTIDREQDSGSSRVFKSGRAAASGLIIGLKGQFPFDGTQFPSLPWGGVSVSASDIAFISQWIDDGCPANDHHVSATAHQQAQRQRRAEGHEAHPPYAGSSNGYYHDAGGIKARKNINCLSENELCRLRSAIAKMKSYDQFYQDERSFAFWGRIHANACQHGWEEFLTWHRAYLYFFEKQLQDIDPSVTLPYWDWAADRANVEKSLQDMAVTGNLSNGNSKSLDNGCIPVAYHCWVDAGALANLQQTGVVSANTLTKLVALQGKTYDSGNRLFLAAGIVYGQEPASDTAIMAQLEASNPLWHQQRWPGGNANLIFESYPSPEDVDRILKLGNFFQFASGPDTNHFFGELEQIHNLIHNFSGGSNPNYNEILPASRNNVPTGDMVNAGLTAFDPIFWGHHANIDRLWAQWQELHPNVGPDDPTAILPPWRMTVAQTSNIHALGYEYVKGVTVFPVDNSMSIQRIVTEPVTPHPLVLAKHRKAEIRLHKVKYPNRVGYHIRVFLNQVDANEQTQCRGNPNYVGILHIFSGTCIGGPGHCDEQPEIRPRYDHRGRSHKAAGNYRLDATGVVQGLSAQGESEFHINLVVLNNDGSPAQDALIFDAVSFNFFD